MMKKTVVKGAAIAASICAASVCGAQEAQSGLPLRVLMIGNSFSISCMSYLPEVSKSASKNLDIGSLYIPGCPLERHAKNIESELSGGKGAYDFDRSISGIRQPKIPRYGVTEALKSAKWDVVTIQQASPLSWRKNSYRPWGDKVVAAVRELAPGARIVVQETWSYTPFDARLGHWKMTQGQMHAALKEAYSDFAHGYGFDVIPMGDAVEEWRRRLPVKYGENSFGGDVVGGGGETPDKHFRLDENGKWRPAIDVFHLNGRGEYLQALLWGAKLLDIDPFKVQYRPDCVTEEEAHLMREIVRDLVK